LLPLKRSVGGYRHRMRAKACATLLSDISGGTAVRNADRRANGSETTVHDLRIGPTLPPLGASDMSRSFDDMENIMTTFEGYRIAHQSALTASSIGKQRTPAPARQRQQQDPAAEGPPTAASALPYPGGFSFAHCMVQLVDPSASMLSAPEAHRCTAAFVERGAAMLQSERHGVASEFRAAMGSSRAPTLASVLDSLRDPVAALSDDGLNDAAIFGVTRRLGVAVVIRRRSAVPCVACIPASALPEAPAVLVEWDPQSRRFVVAEEMRCVAGIQRHLAANDAEIRSAAANGPQALAKRPLAELHELAGRCALHRSSMKTKAGIAEAICSLAG